MKKILALVALSTALNLNAAENTTMPAPRMGEFVWNELATTNIQEAKNFYSKVFGWEFIDKNMGEMTYTIIKKEGKEFGGIWSIPTEQQKQIPPHWIPYVLVENVEQSLTKVRKNGGTVIKPVQKAGDMGLFAIIKDPSGAHLALWQTLKP
jgi:predicted enzyme related to lactoylglutathione lyase